MSGRDDGAVQPLVGENELKERALRLHRKALIVDGHSDILRPAVAGVTRLDAEWPAAERERWKVVAESTEITAEMNGMPVELEAMAQLTAPAGQYELPLLERGGVTAQCVAIYIAEDQLDHALETALQMIATLNRHVEANADQCTLAISAADIERAKADGKVAYVLTMEGAEPIGRRLDLLDVFERLGLRMTTLTHSRRNLLADGTQQGIETGGLTALGRGAVRRCAELGVVLDLAHISDRGFWDTMEVAEKPVVWSHTSVLQQTPGYRSPWDEVNKSYGMSKIEAIARTGGLIGVIFWGQPDTAAVLTEIETIIDLVGPSHVGIGTDFFGFPEAPRDLQHSGELPRLTEAMVARGFNDDVILSVLGGNLIRVFTAVWK